jgi:8-oxo-dGTP pyrophosphatase MutT (NUDIX family)
VINFDKITVQDIQNALKQELPGAEAHSIMAPTGRQLEAPKNIKPQQSAILIPLFYHSNKLHTCLTRRNHQLKKHPGQISFPGGRYELYDSNTQATALRETHEEIGIKPENVRILGKLSNLYIPVSNFMITPYIGLIERDVIFKIDKNEVSEVIQVALSELLHQGTHTHQPVEIAGEDVNVPCYIINGNVIWGATSMILAELEAILKKHCSRRAKH